MNLEKLHPKIKLTDRHYMNSFILEGKFWKVEGYEELYFTNYNMSSKNPKLLDGMINMFQIKRIDNIKYHRTVMLSVQLIESSYDALLEINYWLEKWNEKPLEDETK